MNQHSVPKGCIFLIHPLNVQITLRAVSRQRRSFTEDMGRIANHPLTVLTLGQRNESLSISWYSFTRCVGCTLSRFAPYHIDMSDLVSPYQNLPLG